MVEGFNVNAIDTVLALQSDGPGGVQWEEAVQVSWGEVIQLRGAASSSS